MSKLFTILTIVFQVLLTFLVTVCAYMIYAILNSDFGFDGLFGLIIIQPIIGAILSLITIFVCLIIGLPIRLNKILNHWWTTHFLISVLGTMIGLTCLALALFPNFQETVIAQIDGQETIKHIPNSFLAYTGWFLTSFCLLHLYPPKRLTDKIKFRDKIKLQ